MAAGDAGQEPPLSPEDATKLAYLRRLLPMVAQQRYDDDVLAYFRSLPLARPGITQSLPLADGRLSPHGRGQPPSAADATPAAGGGRAARSPGRAATTEWPADEAVGALGEQQPVPAAAAPEHDTAGLADRILILVVCQLCNVAFTSDELLQEHILQAHRVSANTECTVDSVSGDPDVVRLPELISEENAEDVDGDLAEHQFDAVEGCLIENHSVGATARETVGWEATGPFQTRAAVQDGRAVSVRQDRLTNSDSNLHQPAECSPCPDAAIAAFTSQSFIVRQDSSVVGITDRAAEMSSNEAKLIQHAASDATEALEINGTTCADDAKEHESTAFEHATELVQHHPEVEAVITNVEYGHDRRHLVDEDSGTVKSEVLTEERDDACKRSHLLLGVQNVHRSQPHEEPRTTEQESQTKADHSNRKTQAGRDLLSQGYRDAEPKHTPSRRPAELSAAGSASVDAAPAADVQFVLAPPGIICVAGDQLALLNGGSSLWQTPLQLVSFVASAPPRKLPITSLKKVDAAGKKRGKLRVDGLTANAGDESNKLQLNLPVNKTYSRRLAARRRNADSSEAGAKQLEGISDQMVNNKTHTDCEASQTIRTTDRELEEDTHSDRGPSLRGCSPSRPISVTARSLDGRGGNSNRSAAAESTQSVACQARSISCQTYLSDSHQGAIASHGPSSSSHQSSASSVHEVPRQLGSGRSASRVDGATLPVSNGDGHVRLSGGQNSQTDESLAAENAEESEAKRTACTGLSSASDPPAVSGTAALRRLRIQRRSRGKTRPCRPAEEPAGLNCEQKSAALPTVTAPNSRRSQSAWSTSNAGRRAARPGGGGSPRGTRVLPDRAVQLDHHYVATASAAATASRDRVVATVATPEPATNADCAVDTSHMTTDTAALHTAEIRPQRMSAGSISPPADTLRCCQLKATGGKGREKTAPRVLIRMTAQVAPKTLALLKTALESRCGDDESAGEYPCCACSKRFMTKGNLRAHLVSHTQERPFHCSACPETFSYFTNAHLHLRRHAAARCTCQQCGKTFVMPMDLVRHQRTHSRQQPRFACGDCPLTFGRKDNWLRHRRRQHAPADRPPPRFACQQCPASFTSRHWLRKHRTLHADARDHVCSVCGLAFALRSYLERHRKLHGQPRLHCPLCPRRFVDVAGLTVHRRACHGLADAPTAEQPDTVPSTTAAAAAAAAASPPRPPPSDLGPPTSAAVNGPPRPTLSTDDPSVQVAAGDRRRVVIERVSVR